MPDATLIGSICVRVGNEAAICPDRQSTPQIQLRSLISFKLQALATALRSAHLSSTSYFGNPILPL